MSLTKLCKYVYKCIYTTWQYVFFSTAVQTRVTSIVKARQKYVSISVISAQLFHQRQTGPPLRPCAREVRSLRVMQMSVQGPSVSLPRSAAGPQWPAVLHSSVPRHAHSQSRIVWNNARRQASVPFAQSWK